MILIDKSSSPATVYDFDSTLSFPVSATEYLQSAIRDEQNLLARYRRYRLKKLTVFFPFLVLFSMFRVIPAREYLDTFASDRSHMLKKDKTTYNAPPPPYPPIRNRSINIFCS